MNSESFSGSSIVHQGLAYVSTDYDLGLGTEPSVFLNDGCKQHFQHKKN